MTTLRTRRLRTQIFVFMGVLALAACAGSRGAGFADVQQARKQLESPDRDRWQKPDEVVRLLDVQPSNTVVDLGAGTGYFLPRLSAAVGPVGQVVALDVEPSLVRHVKKRAQKEYLTNVRPRVVEEHDPKLGVASADRVLVVNTWHHLADRVAYAAKLRQALRPGGRVLIVDFGPGGKRGPPPERRLSPETVMKELRQAQFEVAILSEDLPEQYVVEARHPVQER